MRPPGNPLRHPWSLLAAVLLVLGCGDEPNGTKPDGDGSCTGEDQPIRIEAESFTAFWDSGGTPIAQHHCGAASQKLAVDGVDRKGEWIECRLRLEEQRCSVHSLRSAGKIGLMRTFAIQLFRLQADSSRTAVASDTLTTLPGAGIG